MNLRRPRRPPKTKAGYVSLIAGATRLPHLLQIHAILLTTGLFFASNAALPTTLFRALCAAGHLPHARRLFGNMPLRRPRQRRFLCNTLVHSYVVQGQLPHSFVLFRGMLRCGIAPDGFSLPPLVRACASVSDALLGASVHALAVKNGLHCDLITGTELAVMYAKAEEVGSAEMVFAEIRYKDLIAWNALLSALLNCGYADRVLNLASQMEAAGIACDSNTLVSVISACGFLGSLDIGSNVHAWVRKEAAGKVNVFVQNALIDMYAKCGCMDTARALFEEMAVRNEVSWSTMIGGYAVNGESWMALAFFSRMKREGMHPNEVTYLAVLTACSHAGLVDEAKVYFRQIENPGIEHYSAMTDLFGRSGLLEEAYSFIRSMPIEPDAGVWGALLAACSVHQNTEYGLIAADHVVKLAPDTASYQVLLSNIYAACGRWEDAERSRKKLRSHPIHKVAAYSSVEMDGVPHLFYSDSHAACTDIRSTLDWLTGAVRAIGYAPMSRVVLHNVEQEEKDGAAQLHSEKLALAFFLSRSRGSEAPIRIMKNLRICGDCHSFFRHASRALGRLIVVRDKSRFHHFRHGECSCNDFW